MPVRDETGKFIGVRPQTAAERRQVAAPALLFAPPARLYSIDSGASDRITLAGN